MEYHPKAKHQDDGIHVKNNGPGQVQPIKGAVINQIDQKRIDHIISGLSQPDKNIVNDGRARVSDIKGNQLSGDSKNLLRVGQVFNKAVKRFPKGNGERPENHAGTGDKTVGEPLQFRVSVFAVGADHFREGRDRDQQPAPDKIVCEPVVSLFPHQIDHFADHNRVNQIIHKLLQARKNAGSAPRLEDGEIRAFEPADSDVLLCVQQSKTDHRKRCIYENIRNRRSVHAPIRDQEKVCSQRQKCSDRQEYVDVFVRFRDGKYHKDKAHSNAGHESGGFQAEVPADGGKVRAVRIHGPYECFPMEKNTRRENGV
ncbi:MAG: hypothetical protein HFG00_11600 [Oscillibacter sp.]|nr:hypothetical protein [Oscillibacter sp.]